MKVRVNGASYMFWCQGCEDVHRINDLWGFNGDIEKPTFTPSIFVHGHDRHNKPRTHDCHSFVTDGQIIFLNDCTHQYAGLTLPLLDLPDYLVD